MYKRQDDVGSEIMFTSTDANDNPGEHRFAVRETVTNSPVCFGTLVVRYVAKIGDPEPVTTVSHLPSDSCCSGVIKIVAGQSYPAGQLQWQFGKDITGQEVTLSLQGQTFTGSASGMVATVPLTSAQTQSLEKTTHERSDFRLKVGDNVIIGRAEIL